MAAFLQVQPTAAAATDTATTTKTSITTPTELRQDETFPATSSNSG